MNTAAPNLYEALGVASSATPEEIKAAYRKAASAAHPDKNKGDEEAAAKRMAAINTAYDVLGDQERRQRYDETGSQREPDSLEQRAFEALAACFTSALAKNVADPIAFARSDFRESQKAMNVEIDKAHQLIARLKKKRDQVKVKTASATNILHSIIDGQLDNLNRTITGNRQLIEVARAALKMLDDYEYTGQAEGPAASGVRLYHPGLEDLDAEILRAFRFGPGGFFGGGR